MRTRFLTLVAISLSLGLVFVGCGGDKALPTGNSSISGPSISGASTADLSAGFPQAQVEEAIRIRGILQDAQCFPARCVLYFRQGVVVVSVDDEIVRELVGGVEIAILFPELAEILWPVLPVRVVGTTFTPEGWLIADEVRIDEEADIPEVILGAGSDAFVPGAVIDAIVEGIRGQFPVRIKVPKEPTVTLPKFPPGTIARIIGNLPKEIPPVSGGKPPVIVLPPRLPDGIKIAGPVVPSG